MNRKFFELDEEKQHAIIDAGYRVFAQNTYKKSPMSEIAGAAGISKALLFYYFRNKRELYLFLWGHCAQKTQRHLKERGCYAQKDFFEMLYRGMRAKIELMNEYPYMSAFALKALYEKEPSVRPYIQRSYEKYTAKKTAEMMKDIAPDQFIEGVDIQEIFREILLASEGYVFEVLRREEMDVAKIEKDFMQMIDFWKKIYRRRDDGERH